MKPNLSDTKMSASRDRDAVAHERDTPREHRSERQWRIAAAQMAAPSTRRWRRAGTFGPGN